jgi:UDP-glucose 4,6-dehydratase
MITLIGHGYVGDHISKQLILENLPHHRIRHTDVIPDDTHVIINAAGYTGSPNVDACEIYKQETIDGNVIFPLKLEQHNIPVVHISSGCVYTGYKEGGWLETDRPNFDFNNGSFYSGAKSLEQEVLMPYMTRSYLLRIRMPFGFKHHPKNFLTKMINYEKLISYENSLSYMPDVASVAVKFATELPEPGIYNVCNPGSSSAEEIVELLNIKKSWFTEEEFNRSVKAPRSNCVLNTDKLQKIFPIQSVSSALYSAIKHLS